jgi:hypothetical protein
MPIALALPFAEAAGIAVAGLSAAAIANKVSEYIKLNPEDSMMILKMINPASGGAFAGEGLSTLFKKKAKTEKEPSIEDLEEIGEDLSQSDKAKVMKAYGKSKGADKRQRMIDIAKKLGLAGEEKERQKSFDEVEGRYEDSDFEEERTKPKFDYTKFFKADGGRIGFANGGENIIGADLKKDPYEQYQDKFQEAFEISKNYPSNSLGPFVEQGMSSDMRHQLGASGGKDTIIDYLSNFGINPQGKFADTVGNLGIGVATALTEIPDAFKMASEAMKRKNIDALTSGKFLTQPLEDVRSNFAAMNIPYGLTTQEKENLILSNYPGYVSNITTPNYSYGTAAAADFQDGQILQPNVVPERIAPATYYNSAPNFNADVLREEEDAQYNLPKTNGIINSLLNMKSTVPQMLLSAATKVPGAGLVLGGLSSLSNLIGNSFENRQLTGEGVIVDEFGRSYDADELNAQNALGGYYTDAARSSRRRDSRIQNMLARQAAGKTISQNNLIALQEQAAREQAARETATAALAAQNASTYGTSEATGGYQSSWGGVDSFMSGSGTAADMGSFADGGRVNYQAGGVATPEQYAAALQKVGAGTETQKRTSLGNYLGDYIATQGQKLGNAAVIPFQAAKGVLGIQGTPITDSMQTSLQNIIQNQIKNSGKLSGNINYNDYGVKTNTQGNEFLGFGDRSFTDPEAALATTLGQASYSVDPKTGKITFTGGTAYDFGDDQFGGLGKFISKGGVFNQLPSVSNKFQPGATEYNPDITLGSDFMKQFNQPKYPDYKTAALQSQYYKNNPSNLDSDLFRAAYARALPDSGIKTRITNEGQVATDYGNYDPSRVYSAYMGNTGTSSSNPFFDQFKGSQYADMPTIMEAMYGTPGNINPYYADGGLATMFRKKQ